MRRPIETDQVGGCAMNALMYHSDIKTHLKIIIVSLSASILLLAIAIQAHVE